MCLITVVCVTGACTYRASCGTNPRNTTDRYYLPDTSIRAVGERAHPVHVMGVYCLVSTVLVGLA